jgi:hypothetical protein
MELLRKKDREIQEMKEEIAHIKKYTDLLELIHYGPDKKPRALIPRRTTPSGRTKKKNLLGPLLHLARVRVFNRFLNMVVSQTWALFHQTETEQASQYLADIKLKQFLAAPCPF